MMSLSQGGMLACCYGIVWSMLSQILYCAPDGCFRLHKIWIIQILEILGQDWNIFLVRQCMIMPLLKGDLLRYPLSSEAGLMGAVAHCCTEMGFFFFRCVQSV